MLIAVPIGNSRIFVFPSLTHIILEMEFAPLFSVEIIQFNRFNRYGGQRIFPYGMRRLFVPRKLRNTSDMSESLVVKRSTYNSRRIVGSAVFDARLTIGMRRHEKLTRRILIIKCQHSFFAIASRVGRSVGV